MAKSAGRLAVMKIGTTAVAGVKAVNLSVDRTPIEITDMDSDGFITYLAGIDATKQISFDVSGLFDGETLSDLALDPTADGHITNATFKMPGLTAAVDTIGGDFYMTNFKLSAPDDAASDFSCTFTSSGTWTRN